MKLFRCEELESLLTQQLQLAIKLFFPFQKSPLYPQIRILWEPSQTWLCGQGEENLVVAWEDFYLLTSADNLDFDNSPSGSKYQRWTLAQFPLRKLGNLLCVWCMMEPNLSAATCEKSSTFGGCFIFYFSIFLAEWNALNPDFWDVMFQMNWWSGVMSARATNRK